jgi:hypothetical protein
LLQNERLDPSIELAASHIPRLFLDVSGDAGRTRQLFELSGYPKQYVDLRSSPGTSFRAALGRFYDDVLH